MPAVKVEERVQTLHSDATWREGDERTGDVTCPFLLFVLGVQNERSDKWSSRKRVGVCGRHGNVKESGSAGGSFGKRCLFLFPTFFLEIRSWRGSEYATRT